MTMPHKTRKGSKRARVRHEMLWADRAEEWNIAGNIRAALRMVGEHSHRDDVRGLVQTEEILEACAAHWKRTHGGA